MKALLLLPFLFVFLICSQTSTQWVFAAAFTISFFVLGITGHFVFQLITGRKSSSSEFIFLKVSLGQLFFLVSFYLINPFLVIFGHWTGWRWGGAVTFYSLLVAFVYFARRQASKDDSSMELNGLHVTHYVIAVLLFGVISRAANFFSTSGGALGLDTHQHIYWTNHIVDLGYLSLTARGLSIVELYSKGLHVLTAIWVSLGFQQLAGSFLKMMPFIQSVLPVAIVAEVLTAERRSFSWRNSFLSILLGVLFFYLLFYCLKFYYPVADLNGTGRLVGIFAIIFPVSLSFAAIQLRDRRRFASVTLFCLPIFLVFAAALNPSLAVSYLFFTVPVVFALLAPMWSFFFERRKAFLSLLGAGAIVSIFVALQDPYLLSFINKAEKGNVVESVLHSIDIYTDEEATAKGIKSDFDFHVASKPESETCQNADCFLDRFEKGFDAQPLYMVTWLSNLDWLNIRAFFDEEGRKQYYSYLGIALIFFVFATFVRLFLFRGRRAIPQHLVNFWFVGLVIVFLAFRQWVAHLLWTMLADDNASFSLLGIYSFYYVEWLSVPLAALILLPLIIGSLTLVAPEGKYQIISWWKPFGLLVGASFCFALLLRSEDPRDLDPLRGFWGPLTYDDIRDFRSLEKKIPAGDMAVVPAYYTKIGNENWLLPDGETAKYLPFGRNNYLFNVRLGVGYRYDWRAFHHSFCNNDPSVRRDFLQKEKVKWLLIAGTDVGSESFYQASKICNKGLKDFGVIFPPVFTKSGKIAYFRIDPTKIQ